MDTNKNNKQEIYKQENLPAPQIKKIHLWPLTGIEENTSKTKKQKNPHNTPVLQSVLASIPVMLSWLDYKLIQLLWVGNIYQLKMCIIFNTAVSLFGAHPRDNEKRCLHNDYI